MRDEDFIRGKVPMTKQEVRAISLSKLELRECGVFYDIGAGTGSVSVEAALRLHHGQVYAIEHHEEACELIGANKKKFRLENIHVIRGSAPDTLSHLPAPDYVFIGGSGGHLPDMLDMLEQRNPGVRIVINIIALETLSQVMAWLNEKNRPAEVISVQIAKARQAGVYHLMEGYNPIYVITLGGEHEKADTQDFICSSRKR